MRIRLSILGLEVWSVQWCADCDCAPADDHDDDPPRMGGSGTHDFERDTAPLDPTDHYGAWEDRHRFGFGGRS